MTLYPAISFLTTLPFLGRDSPRRLRKAIEVSERELESAPQFSWIRWSVGFGFQAVLALVFFLFVIARPLGPAWALPHQAGLLLATGVQFMIAARRTRQDGKAMGLIYYWILRIEPQALHE
jgi:hypothetical protein